MEYKSEDESSDEDIGDIDDIPPITLSKSKS